MANKQRNSYNPEKRKGQERRRAETGEAWSGVERRNCPERRQTRIAEISYFEWASHYVRFQDRLRRRRANEARAAEKEAGEG